MGSHLSRLSRDGSCQISHNLKPTCYPLIDRLSVAGKWRRPRSPTTNPNIQSSTSLLQLSYSQWDQLATSPQCLKIVKIFKSMFLCTRETTCLTIIWQVTNPAGAEEVTFEVRWILVNTVQSLLFASNGPPGLKTASAEDSWLRHRAFVDTIFQC